MDITIDISELTGTKTEITINLDERDIVYDIKKKIFQQHNTIPTIQMELYYKDKNTKKKRIIGNNSAIVLSAFPELKHIKKIYVHNKGHQVDICVANVIEYSGPIITFTLLLVYNVFVLKKKLTSLQYTIYALTVVHYIKRVFESVYVHIHTKTMELKMLIVECVYYIGYYGVFCAWNLFALDEHRQLKLPKDLIVICLFFVCEYNNFRCHIILRVIRLKNRNVVKVPEGNLFKFVYCANYFWEVCSWVCMSLISGMKCIWGFTFMGFVVMSLWAIEKKQSYCKHFHNEKGLRKKAIVPFIL